MKTFILFGPPGAGKGTQGVILAGKYNLCHISTGALLRSEIAAGTPLGTIAKDLIEAGNLVPDEIVENMIREKIRNTRDVNGFLLDGFPRTLPQAEVLGEMLAELGEEVTACLSIHIPEELVSERIAHRAHIEGRADDARPEVIQNRIRQYHERTESLIDYYRNAHHYVEVDGVGTIEEVSARLFAAIDELN